MRESGSADASPEVYMTAKAPFTLPLSLPLPQQLHLLCRKLSGMSHMF
jgi:hypothetical protein